MGGKMDKLKGEAKEGWGKATGDRSTQAEGKFDKAKGEVKETASDARDSIRDTVRGRLLRDGTGRDLGYPGGRYRPPRLHEHIGEGRR